MVPLSSSNSISRRVSPGGTVTVYVTHQAVTGPTAQPGAERLIAKTEGNTLGAPGPATTWMIGGSLSVGSVGLSAVMPQRSAAEMTRSPLLEPVATVRLSEPRSVSKVTCVVIGALVGF